jgi:Tol biopolymer transport system component
MSARSVVGVALLLAASALVPVAQDAPARYYNPRFAPDGRSLIFEATRDGKPAVYTINLDGSGLKRLTDARQNDAQPQWSADGRFITFTSDTGGSPKIQIMAADGTARRTISTGPRPDAAPTFSPNGALVAWTATTALPADWRDISVASADGTGQRLITSGPGNDQAPVFISNDRVVFTREFPPKTDWRELTPEDHAKRRASSEIMAVDVDGKGLQNLTGNDVADANPSWAGGVQRIFFTSSRNGKQELFSMAADGSDARRVMDAEGFSPSVSADGRLATYTKVVEDRSGVFVRDIATGREREVVGGDKPRQISYYNPQWSPDGKSLVFESNADPKDKGYAVYTIHADGSGLRKLTPNPVEDVQPSWSPDGKQIVFSSKRGGQMDLYIMNADGSNPTRLTSMKSGGYYQAFFSPDGQWIAFQGRPDNALFAEQIYVIRRDGTGLKELSGQDFSTFGPQWTPNGQWIAAVQQPAVKRTWKEMADGDMAKAQSGQELVLLRPDGSGKKTLTRNDVPDCCVAWSADGKLAYFISGAKSAEVVYSMNLDGSNKQKAGDQSLLKTRDWSRSPDGRFYAYTKKVATNYGVFVYEVATGRERLIAGGF